VAEAQLAGTWDDVAQTWAPSLASLAQTAGASLTVTVTVQEGNKQAVHVGITGIPAADEAAAPTSHASAAAAASHAPPSPSCAGGTTNLVTKNASHVGAFGGECTCPDGEVLPAGDVDVALGGAEPVLACFGGKPTSYNKRAGPWSHQQVRCGVCASEACAGSAVNVYREKDPAAGGWGGNCLCPNGRIFAVGDDGVDGTGLACEGGVFDPKAINQREGEWSRKRLALALTLTPILTLT